MFSGILPRTSSPESGHPMALSAQQERLYAAARRIRAALRVVPRLPPESVPEFMALLHQEVVSPLNHLFKQPLKMFRLRFRPF